MRDPHIFLSIVLCLLMTGITGSVSASDTELFRSGEIVETEIESTTPADTSAGVFCLKNLLTKAYENNPSIAAARSEWLANVEMYPQLKSLPDPNLTLTKPLDGSNTYELELMQMVPNFRYLDLQGKRALNMSDMARIGFEITVRDVLIDVMKSYYELGYLNRATAISTTNRDLFAQLVELGKLRNAKGEIGASELMQAESRLAQSEYELLLLDQLKEAEKASMRKLLGVGSDYQLGDAILPEAAIIPLDLGLLRKSVTENNQELLVSKLSIDLGNTDLSLARSMRIPDLTLGLMYGKMNTTTGTDAMGDPVTMSDDEYKVILGLNLPIWGGKNKAMVNEAREKRNAADESYKNQLNTAIEETDRLYWKIINLERLVVLYRDTLVPQAQNASQMAQTLYEQGATEFSELLETRMVVGNFEIASVRAQADYLKALADLSRLTGTPVSENEQTQVSIEKGSDSK
jgi:cobalt-zinc-cadmium efflux system outer membrane protein